MSDTRDDGCTNLITQRGISSCLTRTQWSSTVLTGPPLPPLAFMTMAIILLHMFWGVVFFDACEKQRWWAVAAVVISHLVVSCLVSTDSEL